jgi:hypothetical protein
MRLWQQGEQAQAICETCGDVQTTTFTYRDVPFDDGSGTVSDILVGVCDGCGQVAAIPPQSVPAIRRARERATRPLEVVLPAPYLEILDLAAHRIDTAATSDLRKRLLSFALHTCADDEDPGSRLKVAEAASETCDLEDRKLPRKRLSMKITPRLEADLGRLCEVTGWSRTRVIKALICRIEADVVGPEIPTHIAELRRLAAVA